MRVTIIAIGTRGDVQPALALGRGLLDGGHEVRMATFPSFESPVRRQGLEFAPVAEGVIGRGTDTEEGRAFWETDRKRGRLSRIHIPGSGGLTSFSPSWWAGLLQDARSVVHRRLADCRNACEGTDAIVVSVLGTLLGYQMAEMMRVPLVRAYYSPFGSTLAQAPATSLGERMTHQLDLARSSAGRQIVWQFGRRWVNAARRDVLGLPPLPLREFYGTLDRQRMPLLYGFSPSVVSPADFGSWVHVTGYWFLDREPDWEPTDDLLEFLNPGPPPVFVTFGSMGARDTHAATALAVDALARAGQRGILLRPSPDFDLPSDVFAIESVPYDWFFPHLAAVVHHGGAGTTAAAFRAGLPAVVTPDCADQPFWARRTHELGVGPAPIPRRRLSAEPLAEAIRVATTDAGIRARSRALAELIGAEDGVARAVEAFDRQVTAAASLRPVATRSA